MDITQAVTGIIILVGLYIVFMVFLIFIVVFVKHR